MFGIRGVSSEREEPFPFLITVDPERKVADLLGQACQRLRDILSEKDLKHWGDRLNRGEGASEVLHVVFDIRCERVSDGASPGKHSEDICFQVESTPEGWTLHIDYDPKRFDAPRIEAMAKVLQHIADQAISLPDRRLRELSLMDEAWSVRILAWSRGMRTPLPEELLIHRMFGRTAARYPDAIAVESDGVLYSYRDLDLRTNLLAHQLVRSYGIRPGQRVVVSLPPGASYVICILAVLKAGAAFVPVDPSLPESRIRFMVQAVETGHIISFDDPGIDGICHIPFVSTDDPVETGAPSVDIGPEAPAYCLFSSGSTGQPKAIAIPHRSFACIFDNHLRLLGMTPTDRVLQRASLSYLMSLAEIFHALFSGATLVIASADQRNDIGRFIRENGITVAAMTPSLTSTIDASDLACLRILFQAGESASATDSLRLARNIRVCNGYGSSEANTTAWVELSGSASLTDPLPIGRPLDNVDNYILDPFGHLVPPYMAGDMHVGGVGVGLGYLSRKELTAERFIPSPFESSGILFRSGDRVFRDDEGMAYFLGRSDDQVKVRGYRIEPAEVAQAIESHAGVERAVVLPEQESVGTWRLIAYLRLRVGAQVSKNDIRRHVSSLLPEYMVPSGFATVSEIPLLPSGKVDRVRLREIGAQSGLDEDDGELIKTLTEHALAAIWTEMLGVPVRYRDANFFQLGGHSLIAMRLSGRIRKEYDVTVTLPEIFSDGHLGRLAARIDTERRLRTVEDKGGISGLGFLQPIPSVTQELQDVSTDGSVYPASHMQEALWRLGRSQTGILWVRIPTIMYRMHGRLDMAALQYALDMLMASQPTLRTVFFERGGELFQQVKEQMHVPLERSDGKDCSIQELLPTDEFLTRPFDMAKGPLIRAGVISLDDDTHYFRILIHHIVWDGYSIPLILRELSRCYNGFKAGEPVAPVVHGQGQGEYAQAERRWLQTDEGKASLRYWMGRLDLGGLGHPWPFAELRGSVSGRGTAENGPVEYVLSPELSRRIRSFSARRGSSVFHFLMGSYVMTLQGLLPGRAVTVGMVVNMRRTSEELGLVGCLINTLPVTMAAHGPQTIEEYLTLSDHQIDNAFRHDRIPGRLALKEWGIRRGINRHLAPNTLFNFIEAGQDAVNFEGLTTERVSFGQSTPRSDLYILSSSFSSPGKDAPIRLFVSFKEESQCRAQVVSLLDAWVSVMRHCTDGEVIEVGGTIEGPKWVYAFAGESGGFDAHARFHRMAETLGEGFRMQVLPDPEASFGLLPGIGMKQQADGHAERIMRRSRQGKGWLLGEGLGAIDAFAVACALQSGGMEEVGLILLDPEEPSGPAQAMTASREAIDAYERMPERTGRLMEWLFDMHLRVAASGLLKGWTHPMPNSKSQVYRAALAYGLFDPAGYRARHGDRGGTDEELIRHYLKEGWTSGAHPSDRFHTHRYRHMAEGFQPGGDEPLLHALLFGMRGIAGRRRILDAMARPMEASDILSARTHLRVEAFEPGMFRGDVHLLTTSPDEAAAAAWGRWVQGCVHCHVAADGGSPDGHSESTAEIVRRILTLPG